MRYSVVLAIALVATTASAQQRPDSASFVTRLGGDRPGDGC